MNIGDIASDGYHTVKNYLEKNQGAIMNPFVQYRTNGFHKPYRGIPIARLEEFKMFRRYVQATTADSQGRTANIKWRYVFRGPRGKSGSFTPKHNAHSFDVYLRD